MGYREIFEKYLNKQLDEDKIKEVEFDIEKSKVINSYLDEMLDDELMESESKIFKDYNGSFTAASSKGDTDISKLVQRAVNRKLRRYSLAIGSIVLSIVLFLLFGLSPLMERLYYNPAEKKSTFGYVIDLPLSVFTELHTANKWYNYTNITPEGYGRYSLKMAYQFAGKLEYHYVTINKGKFIGFFDELLRSGLYVNSFTRGISYNFSKPDDRYEIEEIKKLPQTSVIKACVSFREDVDLRSVQELQNKYGIGITYIPIRNSDENYQDMTYYGFEPTGTGIVFEEDSYNSTLYPYLDLANWFDPIEKHTSPIPAEIWEQHFKSMLKYMSNEKDFNKAINSAAQYSRALEYVEKSGIKTFGIVVMATPEKLLKLRGDELVEAVSILDVALSSYSR
jgi:hypothetical protein